MKKEVEFKKSLYNCDICRDTGWILTEREKMMPLARECECRKIDKIKNQWKSSGINPEMGKFTFSNYQVWNRSSEIAKDNAMSYFSNFISIRGSRQNSIMFCGQVGSGKTHLSVAIALNLLNSKTKVMYMPYRDVVTKIKQKMLDDQYYSKTITKYQNCDVLLIDDLFKGKINETDINIMFEILNYRYLNYKPIIVSSEFTIERLLSFDEAVGSRIYEMCKDYLVEIKCDIRNNYRLR